MLKVLSGFVVLVMQTSKKVKLPMQLFKSQLIKWISPKNLIPLEERLISPCIPFMQICEQPRGGQLSIHGNIVNFRSNVNSAVHCLPGLITES